MQSSTDKVLHWNVSENCLRNSSLPYPNSIPLSFPTCSLRRGRRAQPPQDQDKTCHVIHHVAVVHTHGIDLPLLHPHSSMHEGTRKPTRPTQSPSARRSTHTSSWCKVPDVKDWIRHQLSRSMEGDQTSSRSLQSQHQDSSTCPLGSNLWTSWPPAQGCWRGPAQGRWLPVLSWLLCFK